MSMSEQAAIAPRWRSFRFSSFAAGRFTIRRTIKSACLWGLVFGLYGYTSAIGFIDIAPTTAARMHILNALLNNTGLKALFGEPHNVYSIAGFVDWRNLGIITLVGAIWGLMTATKIFRGEEESGRWELFLVGRTTARRATRAALLGLLVSSAGMFIAASLLTRLVGLRSDIAFTLSQSMKFGLATTMGVLVFFAIGALASQLMPTRGGAAALSAVALGVCFVCRAAGDITSSAHWLVYTSPLGWIELLHPLDSDANLLWFIPIAGLIVVCGACVVYLAGKRDLGDSIVPDKDNARPHLLLLGASWTAGIRFSRSIILSWLSAVLLFGAFFGSLAKSAGQAFSSSAFVKKLGSDLIHQTQVAGAKIYVGFIFFLIMTLMMIFVAAAVGKLRDDEAEGYLDNILVRRTGRGIWLWGRVGIIFVAAWVLGFAAAVAIWTAAASQHTGLAAGDLIKAGVNAVAPAVLVLGIGVFAFGFLPRLTSTVLYGYVVWSFLLQLVGSILSLSHWLLDTSAFYHVTLAPSATPDWKAWWYYIGIGFGLAIIGSWRFRSRDIVTQ